MKVNKSIFIIPFLLLVSFIHAQENQITKVKIKGHKRLKISYLQSVILTQKNKPLDSLKIEEDIIFLKRLPAISNVSYQVNKIQENNYEVLFTIEENFTIIPEINLWTTTNNQFSYKLGLYDYNFLGRNITFGGFYQNNGFDSYAINFRAPNLFSKKWGVAINHQDWKSEEPLYFGDKTANYLYNNISFEVLALHQINLKNSFDFGFNFFSEKYKYLSGATDASIPQNLDLDKILLKLVYSYDSLNYFFQYVTGFKSVLYAQYVITENDFQNDFLIAWNDFFYYRRIGAKGNWANRLRFGLSSNDKTPFAPFALDNNINLRGVGILVDRGTGSIVLNTEYRHTIYDKGWLAIQTNMFTDAGSWRNPGGELNDFFKEKNIRIYSGIGLRFISKKIYNATFRIDYGFSLLNSKNNSKGGLVFGIGQYF
ncbi:outer membrane protein assembly factor [Polaribacter batillariae]|uniref:Outer membrane protein assembly factor n=1 Tax=Polaribacter batillariae TaxID=2808900 RepID=A0ABX7SY92_9FLAO|nr:POTRA domain-containing protein [Polaribacter batillariae]QTD38862.1 outer membrane protein assembly factor [Polaribacter batillariae]